MAEHPITPPPELVEQWVAESLATQHLCTQAVRWGWEQRGATNETELQKARDEELEACVEIANENLHDGRSLRDARRPKPPSLKDQALEALKHAPGPDYPSPITLLTADEHALIRRALEALDD